MAVGFAFKQAERARAIDADKIEKIGRGFRDPQ